MPRRRKRLQSNSVKTTESTTSNAVLNALAFALGPTAPNIAISTETHITPACPSVPPSTLRSLPRQDSGLMNSWASAPIPRALDTNSGVPSLSQTNAAIDPSTPASDGNVTIKDRVPTRKRGRGTRKGRNFDNLVKENGEIPLDTMSPEGGENPLDIVSPEGYLEKDTAPECLSVPVSDSEPPRREDSALMQFSSSALIPARLDTNPGLRNLSQSNLATNLSAPTRGAALHKRGRGTRNMCNIDELVKQVVEKTLDVVFPGSYSKTHKSTPCLSNPASASKPIPCRDSTSTQSSSSASIPPLQTAAGSQNFSQQNAAHNSIPLHVANANMKAPLKRRGRGTSKGQNIDKLVEDNGGKPLHIVFPEGYSKPIEHYKEFVRGIGIIVKYQAPIRDIAQDKVFEKWDNIPDEEKDKLFHALFKWFDVEGWEINPAVRKYVEAMFRSSYRSWRFDLHEFYQKMVKAGQDPTLGCPHEACKLDDWLAICAHFQSELFKKHSGINRENRKKNKYTHTSGSKSFHAMLHEMEVQDEIELFKKTHSKNGQFVNSIAQSQYEKMKQKQLASSENEDIPVSQRKIVTEVLGKKKGNYASGMGYGILAPKQSSSLGESSKVNKVMEELSTTKEALEEANSRLNTYEERFNQQESHIQRQDARIETLIQSQEAMLRMVTEFMSGFMRKDKP